MENTPPAAQPLFAEKLFGKYEWNVEVQDPSLAPFINIRPIRYPHTFARHANKQFAKSKVNLVERLANKLMRGGTGEKLGGKVIHTKGRLQGRKTKALRIIQDAFEIVQKKTGLNPIQLLVKAVENSAPREDVTRVRFGGISYQVAVDVSAQRRLDLALRNMSLAAITQSFNNKTTLAEALANELELAGKNSPDSFSVKRRNENERMAKSAR
ncbi:MAG TPA: 30S ribosomal protein S7 [Candidatus Norongarragalinales archaeon]|jgi:small subunit ribosomal protein S7|nr:30S ribosomal protein S7 [Candidatus Norongarragalinales archaeon]